MGLLLLVNQAMILHAQRVPALEGMKSVLKVSARAQNRSIMALHHKHLCRIAGTWAPNGVCPRSACCGRAHWQGAKPLMYGLGLPNWLFAQAA